MKETNHISVLDKTFAPFISKETIEGRIDEIATQINEDYAGSAPVFVIVLNGAFLFASQLIKNVSLPCEITFIRLASYQHTESTGKVRQIIGLEDKLEGRDIIVIEDIVDTGLTMTQLLEQLKGYRPASVKIASLLHKPEAVKKPVNIAYLGFEIKNKFVVGYGLDYEGLGRNLDALYVLAE